MTTVQLHALFDGVHRCEYGFVNDLRKMRSGRKGTVAQMPEIAVWMGRLPSFPLVNRYLSASYVAK